MSTKFFRMVKAAILIQMSRTKTKTIRVSLLKTIGSTTPLRAQKVTRIQNTNQAIASSLERASPRPQVNTLARKDLSHVIATNSLLSTPMVPSRALCHSRVQKIDYTSIWLTRCHHHNQIDLIKH